jgi:DNA-damage-inducible protein J
MAQTNVNIRMDASLKRQAEALFTELGINMTTAFNIFVRQTVRQQRIPLEISAEKKTEDGRIIREGVIIPKGEENDSFYSAANIHHLTKVMKEADEGKLTAHELIEV